MEHNMKHLLAAALILTPMAGFADTSLEGLQQRIEGRWQSISCELRPTANPEGGPPTPTYLTRDFTYDAAGGFAANITVYGDPACQMPMIAYDFAGDVVWHGANPAAEGAFSQDYVLNAKLELTPLAAPMADQLNSLPEGACGAGAFPVGEVKDILGKPCVLLRFVEGSDHVVDHDFLYVRADTPNMLFMGGKHVDGTGFYFPENRPSVGLQQPLIKVE
jgi:hypothetical protein